MTMDALKALCSRISWCEPAVLASSLERALEIAREGREGRRTRGTMKELAERSGRGIMSIAGERYMCA